MFLDDRRGSWSATAEELFCATAALATHSLETMNETDNNDVASERGGSGLGGVWT